MPTFNLLRETPDNSGNFKPTGETIEGSVHDAVERCVALAAKGGRYGMHVYEALRHSDAMAADQAETQAGTQPVAAAILVAEPHAEPKAADPAVTA
jgi:hypothetical protein